MTTAELLRSLQTRLMPSLGGLALADAETVILEYLNISRTRLYTDSSIIVSADDLSRINIIVDRRLNGEPLQYIFGKAYFYDREFWVNPDVLIPRPDTETLVETVLNTEKDMPAKFLDIGTGSGIISATLTAHRPDWKSVATDISYNALRTAARNIREGGVNGKNISDNIILACCDMLTAIRPERQFDFIVSNPPYISSPQMEITDKSVINYEPRIALHGGADGLDYYRIISADAKKYLKDGGRVYLEIGYDQGKSVPKILDNNGWSDVTVIQDLGGRDRVVTAICNMS